MEGQANFDLIEVFIKDNIVDVNETIWLLIVHLLYIILQSEK